MSLILIWHKSLFVQRTVQCYQIIIPTIQWTGDVLKCRSANINLTSTIFVPQTWNPHHYFGRCYNATQVRVISFRVTSLAPGQSYDCPAAGEVTLNYIYTYIWFINYRQASNIRRTLVGNMIVEHSDVVGASPVGAAPTTSSFPT